VLESSVDRYFVPKGLASVAPGGAGDGAPAPASAEPGVAIKIRIEPRRGGLSADGIASPRLRSFLLNLPQVTRARSLPLPHSLHLGLLARVPPGRNTALTKSPHRAATRFRYDALLQDRHTLNG
jgi:hypothetical protein